MNINDLIPYKLNAKIHPYEQIQKIAESIKRFGFTQPVVIDENNVVIIGHGRLEAAKLLGFEQCKETLYAPKGEKYVPYIKIDNLSEEDIKILRLADNKLNESEWDYEIISNEVQDFKKADISFLDFDIKELPIDKVENKEIDVEDLKTKHKCPECGFEF